MHKESAVQTGQTIVVGGNQIGENCDKVEDTVKDVRHTVKIAQQLAPEVDICELPPRINSKAVTQAVAALNMGLQEMAMESGCNFVSTKEVFTLANGNPNDGYILNDGIHLNARGSTKLVECLQIPTLEQANRKVTRMAGYRRPSDLFPNGKLSFAQIAKQQNKQQIKKYKKPMTKLQSTKPAIIVHHKEKERVEQTKRHRGNTENNSRPEPMCKEDGLCSYCGEPGHRYKECRHPGPVVCRSCQKPTHKEKFCEYYVK